MSLSGTWLVPFCLRLLSAALLLALMSGIMLTLMGVLRLGLVANFLSHPVISGFITASELIIAASQLKQILRIKVQGETLIALLADILPKIGRTNLPTLAIGVLVTGFLFCSRTRLKPLLRARAGAPARPTS